MELKQSKASCILIMIFSCSTQLSQSTTPRSKVRPLALSKNSLTVLHKSLRWRTVAKVFVSDGLSFRLAIYNRIFLSSSET